MNSEEKLPEGHASVKEIASLAELLRFGEGEVKQALRVEAEPYETVLIVALFSRATTTLQALVVLLERGFGQQAMMLNRVVFELVVDAYWIDGNRELAQERFIQHARFHQHLKGQVAEKYPALVDGPIDAEARALDEDDLKVLRKLYLEHGTRSWTSLSIHERVDAIVEGFDDPRDRDQLIGFRDVVHRLNNEELHPTPWSVRRVLRRRPSADGREVLQFRVGPEPELGELAVRSAWWMYLQMLALLISTFDLPLEEALNAVTDGAVWAKEQ